MGWVVSDKSVSEGGGKIFKFVNDSADDLPAIRSIELQPNRVGATISVTFNAMRTYYQLQPIILGLFGDRCGFGVDPFVCDIHLGLNTFRVASVDSQKLAALLVALREVDKSLPVEHISNETLSRANQVIKNSALMKLNVFVIPQPVSRVTEAIIVKNRI